MKAINIFNTAYSSLRQHGIPEDNIHWMERIPPISELTDQYFMSELSWCIYNAGMKETVIRQKWPYINDAFFHFIDLNAIIENESYIVKNALQIFNHKKKVNAVIAGVRQVLKDGPMKTLLPSMTEKELLQYLVSFPFIGQVTKYHLARNLGVDVVKPDRHLVRLAGYLQYDTPDALVTEISRYTGIRKGTVDYILWQWMAFQEQDSQLIRVSQ